MPTKWRAYLPVDPGARWSAEWLPPALFAAVLVGFLASVAYVVQLNNQRHESSAADRARIHAEQADSVRERAENRARIDEIGRRVDTLILRLDMMQRTILKETP